MQIIQGEQFLRQSKNNAIRIIPQKAVRGKILDRNGVVLAQDRLSLNVSVIPQGIDNKEVVFKELSDILGLEAEELELKFRRNISAPFVPVVIVRDIDKKKALLIAERINMFSGVIIESEPERDYPHSQTAAHILGYLGMQQKVAPSLRDERDRYGFSAVKKVGISGIEKYLEHYLRGKDGGMQVEVDNRGRRINLLGFRHPYKGSDVKLSIDIRYQKLLEESFAQSRGAAILMDPFNGEILALVSSPSFDPAVFIQKTNHNLRLEYLSDRRAPLFNRAISGQYPPGSIFKIITSLAGLSLGKIDKDTHFFCSGEKLVGRRVFKCWSRHGDESFKEAIIHSCNVFFYTVGLMVGAQDLAEYARLFFLGLATGIDLPAEESGFVPSPKWRKQFLGQGWYGGDTANLAIGQGSLLVTPLQVVRMISVIANHGYLVRPHLISKVGEKEVIYKRPPKINIKEEHLEFIRQALREVVSDDTGTAHIVDMDDVEISAKTGTAQAGAGRKHGWITGFAPYDNPQVSFVIFLQDSQGGAAASALARKFFRKLRREKLLLFEAASN